MDSFTATNKILENLKLKYRYVDNIMNLTKDLERAMLTNDSASFGTILDMRGDVMIQVDKLDQENKEIISHLPHSLRDRISTIIMPKAQVKGEALSLDNPLETNIYDTNKRISTLLGKVVKLDSEIGHKLEGKQRAPRLKNVRG